MNLKVFVIGALLTTLTTCSAMDRLEKHAFLNTECQLPAGSVIIKRLTNKTALDERDDETYNLAHVLGGKKESVFTIENRVVAALKRHYTTLAQQGVFRQDQLQGLVDFHKQAILNVLLQDYPEIVQEYQKLWAGETKAK